MIYNSNLGRLWIEQGEIRNPDNLELIGHTFKINNTNYYIKIKKDVGNIK